MRKWIRLVRNFLIIVVGCVSSSLASAALDLEDPTRPSGQSSAQTNGEVKQSEALRLQAIFNRTEDAHALINNRLVRVGQQTNEFRVLEISPNSVLIERPNGTAHELVLTVKIKDGT